MQKKAVKKKSANRETTIYAVVALVVVGLIVWWLVRSSNQPPPRSGDVATQSESARAEERDSTRPNEATKVGEPQDEGETKRGLPAPPDVAAPPANAEKTKSGLASRILEKGTGTERPTKWDKVTVNYTGWTTDGQMFDSSITDGEPVDFVLYQVIPGWTEGLQLMVEGEKRRLWIPEELAYKGQPGAPQGMLVFDVHLLKLERTEVPPVPPDVSGPPANAEKTPSGLASRVLQKGTGTKRPSAENIVKVNYSGWTTDGEMFDSSLVKGRAATFPLGRVIKGWTEGVQLMVEGEKRRFWIPEELAYKGRPNRPQGMLVFDIELLEIVN
jgi:FKBP-type peptidyl-prolyl cis-trans isomerase